MKIKVELVEEEDGRFSIFAPEFPGCMSQGDSEQEAIENIKEVIPIFLEIHRNRMAKISPHHAPITREIEIEA